MHCQYNRGKEYQEVLQYLRDNNITKVMVTGPQRSGTTICAKMLASDLSLVFVDEREFYVSNIGMLEEILRRGRVVVQAPVMAHLCHEFPDLHIVFMRRDVNELVASQERINWGADNERSEKGHYIKKFGIDYADNYKISELKYKIWEEIQKPTLGERASELEYDSLSVHPMWIDRTGRKNLNGSWDSKQTEIIMKPEDLGGFHTDRTQAKWPMGSVFANEGLFLYNLVREIKPKIIVEIGTNFGCSTSYLAFGCKDNGFGEVHSYDTNTNSGSMIPKLLGSYVKQFPEDATLVDVKSRYESIDFLFEDGAHVEGFTGTVLRNFRAPVVAVHGVGNPAMKEVILDEAVSVLGQPNEVFMVPPSNCGIGLWKGCSI